MKKVLVTGATGFIGRYVVEQLLQTDNISVIATSSNSRKAAMLPWFDAVQYLPFDFGQLTAGINYFDYFDRPDAMIHLAWGGLPNYKSDFHLTTNLPQQASFIKNMVMNGLVDITITGTCFEYGMQEGCLSEDMAALPANPYAIAKDSLRKLLMEFQVSHPFMLKWVRLFYMYGRGQNPNSLLSQLDAALVRQDPVFNMSGGEQVRDFLPVEQVAAYIVKIALQSGTTGIINCCSGKPVTVKHFVEDYLRQKGQSIILNTGYYAYPDYEPMQFWGDNSKFKSITNND